MNRFVVVSGLPASGKSTLATALSQALLLPLLDKDAFLETLFDRSRGTSEQSRHELSRQADACFREQAEHSAGAVLASWWKHPRSTSKSGTPTGWLIALPGVKVEVHCRCSAGIAAERFLGRKRHAGHLDERWSYAALLASLREYDSLGPLGLWPTLVVDTESQPDVAAVLEQLNEIF